jgi:hypothetical protein
VSNDPNDPYGGYGAGDPYGGQPPHDPYGGQPPGYASGDPYAQPPPGYPPGHLQGGAYPPAGVGDAARRVKAPAVFLIVANIISLLVALVQCGGTIYLATLGPDGLQQQRLHMIDFFGGSAQKKDLDDAKAEILKEDKQAAYVSTMLQNVASGVVWLLASVVALYGAFRMMALKSYGLAVTSAILTAIPCVTPCCLLGQIAGIWAAVVLFNPAVRSAFR